MKKLSIIIPVYNVESFLTKCLNSIEPLINKGHEIIIVNDGSTDNSFYTINLFLAKYPDIIYIEQTNQGLSAARNTGLKYASGDYVWFVDSDDYLDLSNYSTIENSLYNNSDIVVFGRIEEHKEGNIKVPIELIKIEYKTGIEYFCDNIRNGNFRTNVWDKIISNNLIKEYKLQFENGLLYEDMFFSLMMFVYAKKVAILPIYPYHYICYNNNSITKQVRNKDLDVLTFIEKANIFMKNNDSNFNNNSFEFQLLIFNWVSSCLLNKYAFLSFTNKEANTIFHTTTNNLYFQKSIKYCMEHNVGYRRKLFAYLITYSPTFYRIILSISLYIRHFVRIFKNKLRHGNTTSFHRYSYV